MPPNLTNLPDYSDIHKNPPQWLFDVLNEQEAAGVLKSTPGSLRQMRYLGKGPEFLKLGSKILYFRRDLLEWLFSGGNKRRKRTAA